MVASELGRPDDGTDPTGFFNDEFFVGLKPYSEWTGPYRTKPELIEAINKKLEAFPGIVFNYTQPAEDAVDEAETGLEERAGGQGLRPRPQRAGAQGAGDQAGAREGARHRRGHGGQAARPAQPDGRRRPRQDRPLRPQRGGHQRPDRGGGRRRRGDPGGAGREAVRPGGPPAAAVPADAGGDRQHPRRHARRPAGAAQGAGGRSRRSTAPPSSTARTARATSASSTRSRGATWRARSRTRSGRSRRRSSCPPATGRSGAASTRSTRRRASSSSIILPLTLLPDLPAALPALQQLQVPVHHGAGGAALRPRSAACSP